MVAIDEKLKRMPRTVRVGVVPGGLSEFITIQDAINWCAAQVAPAPSATTPYIVEVWPGLYNENIVMSDYVYLQGIGDEGAVVVYVDDDDDIVTLAAGYQEISNITIRLNNPTQARTLFNDGAVASDATYERVRIEINTPGAFGHKVFQISGGGSHSVKHCYCNIASGAGTFQFFVIDTVAADVIVVGNDFTIDQGDFWAISIAAATVSGGGNRWVGSQASLFNISASGLVELDRDTHATEAADVVNLANANVVLREGPDHFQVWPGMQIQHALNNLSVGGGKIELIGSGSYALTAQVLRAIDNVQVFGNGVASRIELDGVTAVISAGVQDGWILRDFDTDAGLVDIASATNSTLHNITINGLHGTVINPDLGQTNFPGQPVIRLEEIRPLNPALTQIIKQFGQIEHQLYNPIPATPEYINYLMERQARVLHVPINDLWTDNSTGTGSSTLAPLYALLQTAAAGGDDGLAYCVAAWINSSFGLGVWDRVDFNNKIIFAVDMARVVGSQADLRGRIQLKQVNTEGILAAHGLGIEIQNLGIYGESYGAARSTVSLATTMVATYTYRVRVEFTPGVKCDFFVNDQFAGSITTVANLPSGLAAGTCYWVVSMDNGAVATASDLYVGPIIGWNKL